jgi:PAS domain S-box-containing protein
MSFESHPLSEIAPGGRERLVAAGEMRRSILAHDWSKTPLGPRETWPSHLRWMVDMILDAGVPMALAWGEQHHFIYNDSYAGIIQDKHPAALGAPAARIFPEIWEKLAPLFAKVMSGEPVVTEDLQLNVTRQGVTKPGFFSFNYNPLRNSAGQVEGFLAVVTETTGQVSREQERANVFDTVLSAITDFAYTFDRDGRFLYVNKALLDLWGLKLEQAVGKNFFDLKYPDELAARLQRQIHQVFVEKSTVRDETRYVSPTGVEGFYEYIFSPVLGPDGSVVVVAGSTRDITRRKQLEMEAVAAVRVKDAFLAMLSHELRTPLNPALLLATEAANDTSLPARVRADFQSITESIGEGARLIDDLLDISRITHDKLSLQIQPLALQPILLRALESLEPDLREKHLQVTRHIGAEPMFVNGDEGRLRQIFANLLRNAVKFTPEGGTIGVSTRLNEQGDRFVVDIRDSGIGLTAEELKKIFEPFAQGEHSAGGSSAFGGLGLGLAIARKLVESHSGRLSANSPGRNHGATFSVELPQGTPPVPNAPAQRKSPSRPPMALRRVLLVEDHVSSRETLARLLVTRGLEVVQAESAREAFEKARNQQFDLVISDIGLPDQSGYDVMKTLRALYGFRGIALSGYGTELDIARSKEAGFLAHLTKPISAEVLDETLERFTASA